MTPPPPLSPPGFPPPPLGQAPVQRKTHWGLWVGCGCFGVLLVAALFGGLIFLGVSKVMKSTTPYGTAFTLAAKSPEVQAELGTPIEAGLMPMGSVSTTNDSGAANLTISISGPKGAGTIRYRATRSQGVWKAIEHKVTIESTGKVIDLLHPHGGFSI